ncbi:unnamed protein product [Brassicogethes aeneus]|uniref:PH domain-containing protein n=1 Tax=Brassicogethes aeneus TaxID=1431903 RepID=A0A9P0BA40_BRAAE|nr:unnamed protein product [Brassicogethes aeneus]
MAKNTQDVVYEGWLTKSPPTKRIFRARWRKRYFLLTNTGELPGQYILTYYADRHCRKQKGIINLDTCEQVDLGLKFQERKLKFDHVFDIKTPGRTYYLAAETEEEMQKWVDNICKVCGLKSSDDSNDIEIKEESQDGTLTRNNSTTTPVSPVSTNPYIPISECITGKSPIIDPKDFHKLLQYNIKNTPYINESQFNDSYDSSSHKQYMNYVNDTLDPRFYDSPRKLVPTDFSKRDYQNTSPLQSPTDTDSVFTDEDWVHNVSINTSTTSRPSESSNDIEVPAVQKYTKSSKNVVSAPPRPPKPSHIAPNSLPCYLNLTPTKSSKENIEVETNTSKTNKDVEKVIITDDMYDFPRSHNIDSDTLKSQVSRKHCYSNAAPSQIEGTVFSYDLPDPCDEAAKASCADDEEPASPHSQTSSKSAYSNLPSPLLAETMPPPKVNRGLKPKRKLSDSLSVSSAQDPPSPRANAPSVDRKLKPPTPLQERHARKTFHAEEDGRKIRAGPSPVPMLGRSHESLLSKPDAFYETMGKMHYLDLDLDSNNPDGTMRSRSFRESESDTVYKKVDFIQTEAFKKTRNNLEKERQEPVLFKK